MTAWKNLKRFLTISILLTALSYTGAYGLTLYVDAAAAPGGDGLSWPTAYKSLQDALAAASGRTGILVAEGIYKPDVGAAQTRGDRSETFRLIDDVEIYGGYPAGGPSEERNPNLYVTVLSGEINTPGDSNDNSIHVVTASGAGATAILDGVTITAGNADGSGWDEKGGGLYAYEGYPRISNCKFSLNRAVDGAAIYAYDEVATQLPPSMTLQDCTIMANTARDYGGGMYTTANPILINCRFVNNTADSGGAIYAHWINPSSAYTLTNCNFAENAATSSGGAIHNDTSGKPTIVKCSFVENAADESGGAIYSYGSDPNILNCTFLKNSSDDAGGAIVNLSNYCNITNSVFSGNTASGGGAIGGSGAYTKVTNCTIVANAATTIAGGMFEQTGGIEMTNTILWANTDSFGDEWSQIYADTATIETSHNCIQDINSLAGYGNIDADPLFEDADGPDGIVGTADDNLRLLPSSPCIDAGDNKRIPLDTFDLDADIDKTEPIPIDLDEGPRFVDDPHVTDTGMPGFVSTIIVDMGAYETEPCGDLGHPYPPGDLNLDCKVNFKDLAVIGANWLECTAVQCN